MVIRPRDECVVEEWNRGEAAEAAAEAAAEPFQTGPVRVSSVGGVETFGGCVNLFSPRPSTNVLTLWEMFEL